MNTYIDITQITQTMITSLGKDSKGKVVTDKLEPFMTKYMDWTDKMYTELYTKMKIDVSEIKDYASGLMTSKAEMLCVYFAYWTFFEDNYKNPNVISKSAKSGALFDAYLDFKGKWEALSAKMTKFDFTNNPDDIDEGFPPWLPIEGFQ